MICWEIPISAPFKNPLFNPLETQGIPPDIYPERFSDSFPCFFFSEIIPMIPSENLPWTFLEFFGILHIWFSDRIRGRFSERLPKNFLRRFFQKIFQGCNRKLSPGIFLEILQGSSTGGFYAKILEGIFEKIFHRLSYKIPQNLETLQVILSENILGIPIGFLLQRFVQKFL